MAPVPGRDFSPHRIKSLDCRQALCAKIAPSSTRIPISDMDFLGFQLRNNLFVAPMAGVTDRPFRQLCKKLGAGLAVSEMVTSNSLLYGSAKTRRRADHEGEVDPVSVQIAGADPAMMAQAARYNADHGAQIIDINMGCPAKKVCNVMAGSALMQNEPLVAKILEAVVAAVPHTPVTLKFRTGWNRDNRNAPGIARIAEESGIRAIAIHGRTRADQYTGSAEYDTIALVKSRVKIPVIANGDIDTPQKARYVLDYTGADGVMIGRAAQGRPWLFREIEHFLATGESSPRRARKRYTPSCADTWPNSTASTAKRPACASRASTSAGTPRAFPARRISAMP
jgi:tRNA-dihydrouridine synthase B